MTTPLEQIKERLEKMKKKPTQHPVPCPENIVGCAVYHFEERLSEEDKACNRVISDIQAILPSIIQEVVEQAELQGRRTATGDFLKRVDETITRIRTIPTCERPDPVTALFLLKEESK